MESEQDLIAVHKHEREKERYRLQFNNENNNACKTMADINQIGVLTDLGEEIALGKRYLIPLHEQLIDEFNNRLK